MAQTYPLAAGASPVPASMNGYDAGALVLAAGGTVLCADAGGGQTDPVPVQPGDSLNWPPGRPLWLSTTGAGVSATVEPSGAQLFSASGVASQILAQGLAGDIADSIYTTGVRSVDQPVTLASFTGTLADLAAYVADLSLDVTEYNSIRVYCSYWGTHSSDTSIVSDIQTLEIDFTENISGTYYPAWVRQVESNAYSIASGVLPVIGSGVAVKITTSSSSESLYDGCSFKILGSLRDVPDERWVVINNPWNAIATGAGALTTGFVSGQPQYTGKTQLQIQPAAGQVMTFYPSWRWSSAGPGISWSWGIMANAAGNTAGSRCYLHTTDASPAGGASPQWAPSSGSFSKAADNTATVCFRDTGVSLGTRQPILMLENMNTVSNIEYSVNLAYV